MKYLHHLIDKVILFFIGRSFVILADKNKSLQKELSYLPDNFIAAVAVDENGPYVVVGKEGKNIKYYGYHKDPGNTDLKIYFKDEEFAYQVLSAKEGIRQAFSEHKVIIEGDIKYAVSFIYILEIVEAHLMSDEFAEQVLSYDFKREMSRIQLLIRSLLLFKEKGRI